MAAWGKLSFLDLSPGKDLLTLRSNTPQDMAAAPGETFLRCPFGTGNGEKHDAREGRKRQFVLHGKLTYNRASQTVFRA